MSVLNNPRTRLARNRSQCSALAAMLSSGFLASCFPTDIDVEPPLDEFNFPVALALGEGGQRLYVANSDFDLRFNDGVVQVLDVDAVLEHLPVRCQSDADCDGGLTCDDGGEAEGVGTYLCVDGDASPCGALAQSTPAERFNHPGPCEALALDDSLILDAARIGPFVADIRYVPAAEGRDARILMPVRGDATLHWADVEASPGDGPVLDCGQRGTGVCDADHRRGDQKSEQTSTGDGLPTEPFGIAVGEGGSAIFIGHQSQGSVSVFDNGRNGPELRSVLTDLPSNPIGLVALPVPAAATAGLAPYEPGVLVSFRYSGRVEPNVELLRYYDQETAAPGAPYLHRARSSRITTAASGLDSRGIAVDASARQRCEQTCAEGACQTPEVDATCTECLLSCAAEPVDVFLANRGPDSLLIGQTGLAEGELPRDDVPDFSDSQPLRGGVSRVVVANVTDTDGTPASRVFVLAFDARILFIYDPVARAIETHVQTGPGPQSIVVDETRALAYLAHFTDSYIGVIDLDKRHATYGRVLLNVGRPRGPRSSK